MHEEERFTSRTSSKKLHLIVCFFHSRSSQSLIRCFTSGSAAKTEHEDFMAGPINRWLVLHAHVQDVQMSWYDGKESNSTLKNKLEMQNKDFSYDASFSKELNLKICRVYSNLANFRLDRIKSSTGGYRTCGNMWKMQNEICSCDVSSLRKSNLKFCQIYSNLVGPELDRREESAGCYSTCEN